MSILAAFNTQLVNFFEELCTSFPEEKDIKMATEAVKSARKINPRLILDLFRVHVYNECAPAIYSKDINAIREMVVKKITTQFNDMLVALSIFNKHWDTMGETNRNVIMQYLNVLCVLCEKATATGPAL
jgi:hypothetical protein